MRNFNYENFIEIRANYRIIVDYRDEYEKNNGTYPTLEYVKKNER